MTMKSLLFVKTTSLLILCLLANIFAEDVVIHNNAGIKCVISEQAEGYALGAFYLNGKLVETPLTKGIMRFKNTKDNKDYWFFASKKKVESETKASFSGQGSIDGVNVKFNVTVEAPANTQSVRIIYDFTVDKDIKNCVASLQFYNEFTNTWKCHMYPWVMESKWIARDPLDWMGVPSLFMYRDDRSAGMLWGIDPNSDYLNPTTWTKDFGLFFTDGVIPAQFNVGGEGLQKKIKYHCPMQIVLTDQSDPDEMIIDLMENWIVLNDFKVPTLQVRSNDEAFNMFIAGRKNNPGGYVKGKGYGLHGYRGLDDFMYMGVQGMAAYFDYMLFELTGDSLWRERAFEQMDFILEGQVHDSTSLNYGAIHTSYTLSAKYGEDYGPSPAGWNSDDRWNIGYKPDICALCARYMLKMWQLVKDHEKIDRQDWYKSAINMIDFSMRQQNEDGGLAQKVQIEPLEMRWHAPWRNLVATPIKSRSSTAGRALPAFWHFFKMTGDKRYQDFMLELEKYHLEVVQNKYFFTGHHPDLPPWEPTEASIWGVTEYWLNRFKDTGNKEYIKHAEANAYLGILWATPKQLSWVKNPTFGGSAEQQHYLSMVVYCYQNRKVECLKRLFDHTQKPLWGEMYDRVVQNIYWTQQETPEGISGGTFERTSLPWRPEKDGPGEGQYNSLGVHYFNEQALDLFLQMFEMYRTAKDRAFIAEDLTTKVYPNSICYFSRDISGLTEVPFSAIPSEGSIKYKINEWTVTRRSWTVSGTRESDTSIAFAMGNFNDYVWYIVTLNGKKIGDYQTNHRGEMYFTTSGSFTEPVVFEMIKKE